MRFELQRFKVRRFESSNFEPTRFHYDGGQNSRRITDVVRYRILDKVHLLSLQISENSVVLARGVHGAQREAIVRTNFQVDARRYRRLKGGEVACESFVGIN